MNTHAIGLGVLPQGRGSSAPSSVAFNGEGKDGEEMEDKLKTYQDMGLYGSMKDFDLITPIKGALNAGNMWFGTDGKIRTKVLSPPDTGYVLARQAKNRKCFMWMHTYFQYYRVVHPGCRDCYKVVAAPRTLDELFVIHNIQLGMAKICASKCGIELRQYTPRPYGAYWYTPLLPPKKSNPLYHEDVRERAQLLYRLVRDLVTEKLGKDVKVILKRSCTEMEMAYGATDKWSFSHHHDQFCALLDETFAEPRLPDASKSKIRTMYSITRWIEHASSVGDQTYLNYTNGKPILADPPINYAPQDEELGPKLVRLED